MNSTDDFEILQTIGTGSFGCVKLVKYKTDGKYYAMKILYKNYIKLKNQGEYLRSEIEILKKIQSCPFSIHYNCVFTDDKFIYIITDFVQGGELFEMLRKLDKDPNRHHIIRIYIAQIVLFLEYVHDRHIIYRDIKPENILINKDGYLQVCDFGFAKYHNILLKF